MRGTDWLGEPVAGCYASRKLNGVACLWDGSQAWTRSGNRIALPAHIRATLPAIALDCEIISGEGGNVDFTAASLAVRLNRWTPDIHAVAFDAPTMPGDWLQRIEAARAAGSPCVSWTVCKGETDLLWLFDRITKPGGEGVMFRKPGIRYRPGRALFGFWKVKWSPEICSLMDFLPYTVAA